MRLLLPFLLVALLLLPAVAAEGKEPEILDPVDGIDPTLDITAAWFETRDDGLRFTVQVVGATRATAFVDRVYWVAFRVAGNLGSATVGVDGRGVVRGDIGPLDGNKAHFNKGPLEAAANNALRDVAADYGTPATFSGTIPWGAIDGLEEGSTLVDLQAGVAKFDRTRGRWIPAKDLDVASTNKAYIPQAVRLAPWVTPTVTVSMAAVGAGAGAFVALRRP